MLVASGRGIMTTDVWVATKVIDEKEESHCSARIEEIKPHPINSHEKKRQSHESVYDSLNVGENKMSTPRGEQKQSVQK